MKTLLPILCVLCASVVNSFSAEPIFRLGTFDYSSEEFAAKYQRPDSNYRQNVQVETFPNFTSIEGFGTKAPELKFTVSQISSAYKLRIAVIVARPGVPAIRVNLNGKIGLFHLFPKLNYHGGDVPNGSRVGYSHDILEIDIPSDFVRKGENSLVLQPVHTGATPSSESGVYWDAIELLPSQHPINGSSTTTRIVPTIFYQNTDSGLAEIIEVYVRSNKKFTSSDKIQLNLDGKRFTKSVPHQNDFGEVKLEFLVPEFTGSIPAKVTATLNGTSTVHDSTITPGKKWTIHVIPHIHLDLSYNNTMPKVGSLQARVIDEAIDLSNYYPDYSFTLDGTWPVDEFLRTRTPAAQQRLFDAMKSRKLFAPAAETTILTGFSTAELLIRQFYKAGKLERDHGIPADFVTAVDVPSYTWSYASIIASSDIKYFLSGSDNIRGPILINGRLHEKSPFWWVGPDNKKVLMWYAFVYRQIQILFGLPVVPEIGRESLPLFFQSYERPDYVSDKVILYGTYGENRDLDAKQAVFVPTWNNLYAYPRMINSNIPAAMSAIEEDLGDKIPTYSGDGGPLWEDGLNGNPVRVAAARAAQHRAVSAEKLSTMSTVANPRVAADKASLDKMWDGLVTFDEHTGCPMVSLTENDSSQDIEWWENKGYFVETGRIYANRIAQNSMATITDTTPAPVNSLLIYNTLNWPRSGRLTYDLKNGYEIIDAATKERIPTREISRGSDFKRIQFRAENIPSMGYKTYLVRRGKQADPAPLEKSNILENDFYKITLDPDTASLTSIYDKQLNKELVDQNSPYKFGQFLYVTGGDKTPTVILTYSKTVPAPDYAITGATNGKLLSVENTPEGPAAKFTATAPNGQTITTEIRLINHSKKIEFSTEIRRRQTFQRESSYIAWPFAMSAPQFQYEIQNGIVDPAQNMIPGAGAEWFSVQHWASVQQDGVSATVFPLDNPLITFGDISRRLWLHGNIGKRPGTIFSFTYTNYHQPHDLLRHWDIPARYDTMKFRHVITSSTKTDPATLSKIGWEEFTPLEQNYIIPRDKSWPRSNKLLTQQSGSFLDTGSSPVLVQTWKVAEDNDGTILRLQNLSDENTPLTVNLPLLNITKLTRTNALERNHDPLPHNNGNFTLTLTPREILTLRINATNKLPPPTIPPHKEAQQKLIRPYIEQDP